MTNPYDPNNPYQQVTARGLFAPQAQTGRQSTATPFNRYAMNRVMNMAGGSGQEGQPQTLASGNPYQPVPLNNMSRGNASMTTANIPKDETPTPDVINSGMTEAQKSQTNPYQQMFAGAQSIAPSDAKPSTALRPGPSPDDIDTSPYQRDDSDLLKGQVQQQQNQNNVNAVGVAPPNASAVAKDEFGGMSIWDKLKEGAKGAISGFARDHTIFGALSGFGMGATGQNYIPNRIGELNDEDTQTRQHNLDANKVQQQQIQNQMDQETTDIAKRKQSQSEQMFPYERDASIAKAKQEQATAEELQSKAQYYKDHPGQKEFDEEGKQAFETIKAGGSVPDDILAKHHLTGWSGKPAAPPKLDLDDHQNRYYLDMQGTHVEGPDGQFHVGKPYFDPGKGKTSVNVKVDPGAKLIDEKAIESNARADYYNDHPSQSPPKNIKGMSMTDKIRMDKGQYGEPTDRDLNPYRIKERQKAQQTLGSKLQF